MTIRGAWREVLATAREEPMFRAALLVLYTHIWYTFAIGELQMMKRVSMVKGERTKGAGLCQTKFAYTRIPGQGDMGAFLRLTRLVPIRGRWECKGKTSARGHVQKLVMGCWGGARHFSHY